MEIGNAKPFKSIKSKCRFLCLTINHLRPPEAVNKHKKTKAIKKKKKALGKKKLTRDEKKLLKRQKKEAKQAQKKGTVQEQKKK